MAYYYWVWSGMCDWNDHEKFGYNNWGFDLPSLYTVLSCRLVAPYTIVLHNCGKLMRTKFAFMVHLFFFFLFLSSIYGTPNKHWLVFPLIHWYSSSACGALPLLLGVPRGTNLSVQKDQNLRNSPSVKATRL